MLSASKHEGRAPGSNWLEVPFKTNEPAIPEDDGPSREERCAVGQPLMPADSVMACVTRRWKMR